MDDEKYLQILKISLKIRRFLNTQNFTLFKSLMTNLPAKYLDNTEINEIIDQANIGIFTILVRCFDLVTLENVNSQSFTKQDLISINHIIPEQFITKKSNEDIESLYKNYIQLGGKRSRNIRRSKRSRNIRRSKKY